MTIIYLRGNGLKFLTHKLRTYRALSISFAFLLLCGCFFPLRWIEYGYLVHIKVKGINSIDIHILEQLIRRESYGSIGHTKEDTHTFAEYRKTITSDKKIKHPNIRIGLFYDDIKDQKTNLSIHILNEWQGKDPPLKQEIDRMGDILYAKLVELVGQENITIVRKSTGPPF
jgi:hypothetical protein